MALTTQQLDALKTAITNDATAGPMRAAGDTVALKAWCNAAKAPAALAWRINVPIQDSDEAASYTAYDTLPAGKRDSWAIFLKFPRSFPKGKVRSWITDVWGNATANSIAEAILLAGTENATNAQVVLGGNSKTTGTVAALDRVFADQVLQTEVDKLVT